MNSFGNRLYELRKAKGLSQEGLAEKLNVTRQTVSKWELGESTPDMEKLIALGILFDISLDELVSGESKNEDSITHDQKTLAAVLDEKVLTESNKKKAGGLLKIAAVIFAVMLAIDAVSFVVYLLVHGLP